MFALARSRRLIPGTAGLFGILDMARELAGRRATITTVGFSFWMTMRPARSVPEYQRHLRRARWSC
jgi:hypothetical protein